MEIRQLEYYKTVVETGSISEAARQLHLSQPPLSLQMKKLEEETGSLLFKRGSRNITLTEAGTILYTRAQQILSMTESALHETKRAGQMRTLHIGMTPSTIPVAGRMLCGFSRLHPEARYQIRDGSSFQLKHLLESREIEAALLRSPIPADTLDVVRLRTEPMAAAVPEHLLKTMESTDSPAGCIKNRAFTSPDKAPRRGDSPENGEGESKADALTLEQLAGFPLSTYWRYADLLTEQFRKHGLSPEYFSLCDDARTTLLWAQQGLAAAIFPMSLTEDLYAGDDHIKGCRTLRIDEPDLETDILLVREKGRHMEPLTEELWGFARAQEYS